ncbi:MAG: hypothetical protein HY663_05460 [Chloroflexi bacterium]|nr:hypothetical protein [Chloroflexota bacterium]
MQRRTWLVVGLLVGVLVLALGATSVFAQGPTAPDSQTWEEMHQACVNGDYEAMAKWQEQCHGEGGAGGMMGNGGMMGSGGMMGNGGMMGSGGMMGNGSMMGNW